MMVSGVFPVRFVHTPPEGRQGLILRRSVWKAGVEYRNDKELKTDSIRYLDIVTNQEMIFDGITEYQAYICRQTHTSNDTTHTLSNTALWEPIPTHEPISTPIILSGYIGADMIDTASLAASQAFINALTVKRLDTVPNEAGSKIVVRENEFSILDATGKPKLRIHGDAIKGEMGSGYKEIFTNKPGLLFSDNSMQVPITGGTTTKTMLLKSYNFSLGKHPAGTVFTHKRQSQASFGVIAPWTLVNDGQFIELRTDGGIKVTRVSIQFTAQLKDHNGNVIRDIGTWSNSVYDPDGIQKEGTASTFGITAWANYEGSSHIVTTLQEDGEFFYSLTAKVEVAIIERPIGDDYVTFSDIYFAMSDSDLFQEPNMMMLSQKGFFYRFGGKNGYGYIVDEAARTGGFGEDVNGYGFMFKSGINGINIIGMDSGGLFTQYGGQKRYIRVDPTTLTLQLV
jgi:hypothetical protein